MKILVTGGAGFIGSQYVRSLLSGAYAPDEFEVTVLDKLTYSGHLSNIATVSGHPRLKFVQGCVCDPGTVDRVMAHQDLVVHFAAESHVDRSIDGALEFVRSNVEGTQTLLDSARKHGVGRFVHVSTDEVYGSIESGSWTEQTPLAPSSPYAASKASSDLLALAAYRAHDMDVVITRCSNNYGPYQFPEKIIPRFVTNLLDGKKVQLYGDGLHVRDWLHVADHCSGVHLALLKGRAGEVYHIGGGTELTNRELTELLLDACDADWSAVEFTEDRKGHDRRYSLDITKIRDELGYEPSIPFEGGLLETVAWYKESRHWWEPLKSEHQSGTVAEHGSSPDYQP